jgi:hypothetical protein
MSDALWSNDPDSFLQSEFLQLIDKAQDIYAPRKSKKGKKDKKEKTD